MIHRRARRLGASAVIFLSLTPGFCRQDPVICGTHPLKSKEELHLHRQWVRTRTSLRKKYGLMVAQPAAAARDIGNIAIVEDTDGVIARRNEFNLDQQTITFTPTAANAARYRFQLSGPGYDGGAATAGAGLAGLGDDDSRAVPLPFPFPFFGATYQQVFLNSDGNLTFQAGDNASSDRSVGRLAAGSPRIAPLFMDLDPSKAPQSVRVLSAPDRFVVTWLGVPEYADTGTGPVQTFQARLYPDGRIEFAYSGIHTDGAVVGISPGALQGESTILSFLDGSTAEYSSTVAERFGGTEEVDIETVAQRFYQTHEDAYDYLMIFNNLGVAAGDSAVAFETTVRNNRSGYGDEKVNSGSEFGSSSRLQAVINFGNLSQYPVDPKGTVPARATAGDTPLSIMAHETGHLFLAYASIREPNDAAARPMLGYQGAHWNFAFNSDASLLEGNRIQDNGPDAQPRFLTTGTVEAYSPLDQYLMGFRSADEVEPEHQMFLVTGVPAYYSQRGPQRGVNFNGQRRDIHIQEILDAEGRRTPDYTVAQRRFRFAVILVVAQGSTPPAADLARLEAYRTGFEAFYQQASSNRAFADTALRRSLALSAFPGAGVLAGGKATATVTLQTPPDAPLTVVLRTQTGTAGVPASVTIPAGATAAAFEITGLRTGVDELSAAPDDSRYDTAYAHIQVATPSMLRIDTVSGDKQAAGSNGTVVVRVADINDLPYPGARVRASSPAGSPVTPPVAVADANGNATFHWAPEVSGAPQLQLSLEGAQGSPVAVVTAVAGPKASGVANAASYTPAISPGSLASIYGLNLAAGTTATAAFPWPQALGNVQVSVNGTAAQLTYVSDGLINFLVPRGLPEGPAGITVSNTVGSSTIQSTLSTVSPGIFFDSTTGYGAVLKAGTAESTAQAGDYIEIYCTGLGPIQDSKTMLTPRVSIGGAEAEVVFSGLTPGYDGLYVVDARIPEATPAGDQPLSLTINGISSNEVRIGVR